LIRRRQLTRDELDEGNVQNITATQGKLQPNNKAIREAVKTEMEYFRRNAKRMRYAEFRSQGLFLGSGVVEAGCKTVIGQRLKLSGMQMSNRWEEFWESRAIG
jgi:hypothetical protein